MAINVWFSLSHEAFAGQKHMLKRHVICTPKCKKNQCGAHVSGDRIQERFKTNLNVFVWQFKFEDLGMYTSKWKSLAISEVTGTNDNVVR